MTRASPTADDGVPEEAVLKRLRIPFVRKAVLVRTAGREDVFVIDLGLEGVFIERADELPVGEEGDLTLPWPGSEVPLRAVCRVAWWHPADEKLASKTLPAGAGLQFTQMSQGDRDRLRAYLEDYCRQDSRVRRFLRHWPDAERGGDDPGA
jgi:Tfp pilus assembly protein PilZ